MKVIIPMAGKGTRLKPHTHTTPKSLVQVAGKPLLEHILNSISSLSIDTVIFIVDKDYPELRKLISEKYSFKPIFILQKERRGVGHAIFGARKYVISEEVLILFGDTLVEADFKLIKNPKEDGFVWTKQVEDPREYGVTFLYNDYISKLIEKPEQPVSDKAIVGMYYFKNSDSLFESIEYLIKNDIKSHGEYQLTDAIQNLINNGAKLKAPEVKNWFDCGTVKNLLLTNEYLLKKAVSSKGNFKNSVLIKPVYIEKGVEIIDSIIGPNVSIGKGAIIKNSIIKNSIINRNTITNNVNLKECIIGNNAKIEGTSKRLNVGDSSEVFYS